MPTTLAVPLAEYLHTSYRPDCDYVDGDVQERQLGSRPHSLLQGFLYEWFESRFDQTGCVPMLEMRVRITPTRVRVPDVCVQRADAPEEDELLETAPLICIEVLSPEDRLSRLQDRVDDYREIGVPNIWIIDPVSHHVWVANDGTLKPFAGDTLPARGLALELDLKTVFAKLEARLRRAG